MRGSAPAGMGILLQPDELVRDDLAAGTLVEMLSEYSVPTRPSHLLYAPDRRMTPKLRSFIDFAVGAFGVRWSSF
jgi:DNA-binding transcriptional LysR family regulator